jgi:hypothetical protein
MYGSSLLSMSQWNILFSNIYSKFTEDIIKNWYINAELQPSAFLYSAHIRHYCDPDYWKYICTLFSASSLIWFISIIEIYSSLIM